MREKGKEGSGLWYFIWERNKEIDMMSGLGKMISFCPLIIKVLFYNLKFWGKGLIAKQTELQCSLMSGT